MKKNWIQSLKNGDLPIYLIHGDAELLIEEVSNWIEKKALHGEDSGLNFSCLDTEDERFDPNQVVQIAQTFPMMGQRRIILIKRSDKLNLKSKNFIEPIIEYLKNPNTLTCMIFQAFAPLQKNKALYKTLKVNSCELLIEQPKGRELNAWILSEMKERTLECNEQTLALLIDTIGEDLGMLRDAIERISLYVSPRREFTIDDLHALLPEAQLKMTVWNFLDAVIEQRAGEALSMSHSLIKDGQSTLSLFSLVTSKIRGLLMAHSISARGGGQNELSTKGKMAPYAAKLLLKSIHKGNVIPLTYLPKAYTLLLQADRQLKGSKIPPEVLFEALILELCLLGRSS